MANEETGPAWERLRDQLTWYDEKSRTNKLWYQSLKVAQIAIAAGIPVTAAAGASATVAGAMGAVIVVLEGLQQLFQFQQNWISYRVTAGALERERFLCLAGAGPYENAARPESLLAQRTERIMSQEYGAWAESQHDTGGGGAGAGQGSDD